jgi:hypothetical protein
MKNLIHLNTYSDNRGNLTVIEKVLPFEIKRVFYIYGVNDEIRGLHRHKKTIQAAIAIQGNCKIFCQSNGYDKPTKFLLDKPDKCLIIQPEEFHWMTEFSKDCILLVLASEFYDKDDYIFENY